MSPAKNLIYIKNQTDFVRHVCLWISVFTAYVFMLSLHSSLSRALIMAAVSLPLYITAYYLMRYVQIPFFAQRKKTGLFILSVLLSSLLLFALYVGIWMSGYGASLGYIPTLDNFDVYDFVYLILRFYSPTFVLLALEFQLQKRIDTERIRLLEKEKLANELKFLKAQINPHFLFNTLNNLYSFVVTESPMAIEMISRLSSVLNYVFKKSQNDVVYLSEEVETIENFIELEQMRYGDRLVVKCDVDGTLDVPLAPLILLSLVENAFKHGASGDIDQPKIRIRITGYQGGVSCQVWNTKSAYSGEQNDAYKEGIGLSNIKRQLDLIYPENYSLDIINDKKTFNVQLKINLT